MSGLKADKDEVLNIAESFSYDVSIHYRSVPNKVQLVNDLELSSTRFSFVGAVIICS